MPTGRMTLEVRPTVSALWSELSALRDIRGWPSDKRDRRKLWCVNCCCPLKTVKIVKTVKTVCLTFSFFIVLIYILFFLAGSVCRFDIIRTRKVVVRSVLSGFVICTTLLLQSKWRRCDEEKKDMSCRDVFRRGLPCVVVPSTCTRRYLQYQVRV